MTKNPIFRWELYMRILCFHDLSILLNTCTLCIVILNIAAFSESLGVKLSNVKYINAKCKVKGFGDDILNNRLLIKYIILRNYIN